MRITQKLLYFSLSLLFMGFLASTVSVEAQLYPSDPDSNYGLEEIKTISIGQSTDAKGVIANIINVVLSFLGIIAVVVILYAGFKWMTAAGNEEQVSTARKMLGQAVSGLAIIFLAWTITAFVISQLKDATTARLGVSAVES